MKKRSGLLLSCLTVVLFLLIVPMVGAQTRSDSKAPIITHSFAVDKGVFGRPWNIYIEAEDPDGDMLRIAAVIIQVGYGYYPTSWTYLKRENGKKLKGYLQWNTSSSQYQQEWTQLTLKVSVFDKAGNESNEVVFPFTFETGAPSVTKLPPPFDQGDIPRLGYININVFSPTGMGNGGSRPW